MLLSQLGGERSPGWRPAARGVVGGLSCATTAGDLLQAALEGVALRLAEIAAQLPVDEVVASGAALRLSRLWRQILADALDRAGRAPAGARVAEPIDPRDDRTEAYRSVLVRQRNLYRGAT